MTLGIHWVTMNSIFEPEEHLNYCGKIMTFLTQNTIFKIS